MQQLSFEIRSASESDMQQWLKLRCLLWEDGIEDEHLSEMREILSDKENQRAFVAERKEDGIAGFVEARIRPFAEDCLTDRVGYIEGWFVVSGL